MKEIAQRLKTLRESVGLSQAKIGALVGAPQASINRYENNQTKAPLTVLLWYADYFDVSMDYIFGRTDNPQGKLYENKPKVIETMTKDNKELREFVNMCFDPSSLVSKKLKDMLAQMLEEEMKKEL